MHTCQEPSCGYENDEGARFCAHCGRQLPPPVAPALRLPGHRQIRETLGSAARLSLPEGLRPVHGGRAAGQTYVFATDGQCCRVYAVHGRLGSALSLEEVKGDWPGPQAWLRPPVYTPLTTAAAAPDRVTWWPTRCLPSSGPVRTVAAGGGERFVGFGQVDDVWLAVARRIGPNALNLEVGSGDGPAFTTLARLHGPIPEDGAVLLGGAPWLANLVQREETSADPDFLLASDAGAQRLPVQHLWVIIGNRLLLLDMPNDRIVGAAELDAPALPATYIARRRAGAIDPVVLSDANAGLYVNVRDDDKAGDGDGLRPAFVPARLPPRATPLQAATVGMEWDRLAYLVPRAEGSGAVFVDPEWIVLYAGTQPGEAKPNPVTKDFEPLAGPGFIAGFVEASLGGMPGDSTSSRLVIYRAPAQGQELSVHADEPVSDMLVHTALPPVFTGEDLQLIGHDSEGLLVQILPIAGTAGQ